MCSDKITKTQALDAVKTILLWIGEDPNREGLIETPARVLKSYEELFAGYAQDPVDVLNKSFQETNSYAGMVLLRDLQIESHCEHHLAPISGKAYIAYVPNGRVIGISKLARVVDLFARRLQLQERLTSQIANAIYSILKPKGVAVIITAKHYCISKRGVKHHNADMYTETMLGCFHEDNVLKQHFLSTLHQVPF